ncbi:MAG TPA: hypothetical protein VMF03_13365 [Steroidobacteraceae bacterium]|nr:hypothetical protein [Steroidobacteraceae bacterium]
MYQKPTVPRSIGGVLDDTFQLYKAAFSSCWLPMVILSLIGVASVWYRFSNVTTVAPGTGFSQLLLQLQSEPPGYRALSLLTVLVDLVLYSVLILNIVAASHGQKASFGASLATALRRFLPAVGASIIFIIVTAVGTVLLVVPGIYLAFRLMLFMVPLLTVPEGPGTALSTSWRLVGGNWWRTFILVCVMLAIMWVVDIALITVVGSATAVFHSGPTNLVQAAGSFAIGAIIVGAITRIFTTPLLVAVLVTVYQDLMLRKEGGDLAARLGALPQG